MFIVIYLILLFLSGTFLAKLPSDFLLCKKTDPHLNKCVQKAIETSFPKLAKGIKQLELPPLEPLTIPSAVIEGSGGPVHLTQKFTNFKINNIITTKVNKYEAIITPINYTSDIQIRSPEYRIDADYDFNGRILVLPIIGRGKCNISLKNIKMNMHLYGDLYDKKGKTHLNLTVFDLKLYPERVFFNFDNLFDGNQMLASRMNSLLNDNWKDVFDDVKSGYERVLGTVFKNYARTIFNKVAWNDLYP